MVDKRMRVKYKGFVLDHVILGIAYLALALGGAIIATCVYTMFTSPLGINDPLILWLLGLPRRLLGLPE